MATFVPPAQDLAAVLSELGISQVIDPSGKPTWTIALREHEDKSCRRQAQFDPVDKSWVVEASSKVTLSTTLTASNGSSAGGFLSHRDRRQHGSLHDDNWWMHILPSTAHTSFFVEIDWSVTSLGPITAWPHSLRFYTSICFSESRATAIFWGRERIAIYNEAAIPLLGKGHPQLMGRGWTDHWPEAAEQFPTHFLQVERTGTGKLLQNIAIPLERYNNLEETWWDADLLPLKEEHGDVGGVCCTWFEITRQVVSDRFSRIVNQVGSSLRHDGDDVWQHLYSVFKQYPQDIAMCLLYSVVSFDDSAHRLKCEGAIGMHSTHQAAPPFLDLDSDTHGFVPYLRKAMDQPAPFLVLDTNADNLSAEVLHGIDWQGYGEVSKHIAIIPIMVFNNIFKGFIVLGLNPRIPLNASHQQFVTDISRQLGALMTTVTTTEQAKRREEKLMQDLAVKERRIRKMAELAPMGMYDLSSEGKLLWANKHFFDILGAEGAQKNFETFSWLDFIDPVDHDAAHTKMASSIIDQATISDSLRLRRTWRPPDISGDQSERPGAEPVWILYQAYPHIENGVVESIMGCITDISQFKWAESVQARSADAARAAKQRLEDFIDITSHEMRNPLSAVTQCADDVLGSVHEAEALIGNDRAVLDMLQQIADTAKSIALCASHQRRIIDDVLTLSKLDSALLSVIPVPSKPSAVVSDAMRMFAAEFASSGIQVDVVDESPQSFGPDDVAYYDATRLMQVLVNLITNAIKFTRAEETREVSVTFGATNEPPDAEHFGSHFAWSNSTRKRRDLTGDMRYGDAATVFLSFAVTDTGQGLPKDEAVHIFDKFIQANRRTYIKYGGSGLGLFISRELIELQAGKIGVSSEIGKGSTFAFYIKAKRGVDRKVSAESRALDRTAMKEHQARGLAGNVAQGPNTARSLVNMVSRPMFVTSSSTENIHDAAKVPALSRNKNLLLVEDNLVNQKVLAKQLRKANFTVVVANHGGEAVDRLLHTAGRPPQYGTPPAPGTVTDTATPFDYVLMDWEMPVLDGLAATKRIRQLESDGIIPARQVIIGVTANARLEQIQQAQAAGMDEIVVKPFRVLDLIERMAQVSSRP